MARFVFRLEPVLRQRQRAEQEAKRELAHRQARLVELQNDLKKLDDALRQASDDMRDNHLTGKLNMNFLAAHRRFVNAMHRQGLNLVQKIAAAQRSVDEARHALAEAAKQRKVIEKLREKQLARWQDEQNRKETAANDEIGSQIGYANMVELSEVSAITTSAEGGGS
jgi:flagellar FliJ protein